MFDTKKKRQITMITLFVLGAYALPWTTGFASKLMDFKLGPVSLGMVFGIFGILGGYWMYSKGM